MMSKLVVCAAGAVALAAGLYARQRGHAELGTPLSDEKSDHKVQEGSSGFPQSSDRKQDMQMDRLSPEGCEQERQAHSILKLKYAEMKKKYDEMKEEHVKLKKSHDEMQQKNDEMKKYHAEMKKNHDEIKEKYKETKKNHGEMKEKYDEIKQKNDEIRKNIGEMKKNHDEMKQYHDEMKKNHDEMKEELDEMKEKHDEIKERLDEMKRNHNETKQKYDKMKQKYEEMKKNHDMKKKHKMKEKHDEMKKYNEMKDKLQKVALAKAEETAQNALESNTQLELKNASLMQQVESLQGVMETLQRHRLTVQSRSNKTRREEEMEKPEDHSVLLSQDEDVKSQEKSHRGTADGPPSAPLLPANLKWSDLFEASLLPETTPTLELEKKHGFEERGDCKLEMDTTPERQRTWRRRAGRVRADAAKKNEDIDCVQKEKKEEEQIPRLQRNSQPRRRSRRRRLKTIPA